MKKMILTLCVFSTLSVLADTPITSAEIKIALGKTIVKQSDIQLQQRHFTDEIESLKDSVKELKKELDGYRKSTVVASKPISIDEETVAIAYFSNIREKPKFNSKSIKQVPICTKMKIKECSVNNSSEVWCQLDNGGYIRKDLLSFNNIRISTSKELNSEIEDLINPTTQQMNILGISQDGRWACLEDGSKVSTRNLNITKF